MLKLSHSIATVDLFDVCALRYFSSPIALAATEEEATVRRDLISLVPLWQETRMLVLVPAGGCYRDVLPKVLNALNRSVQQWRARDVSVRLSHTFIFRAE
ncbi:unnamed protein product, partial [Laminaria digitata]